jgi:hypothetical protein
MMDLMKETFSELDVKGVLELFCQCFLKVSAGEVIDLIEQFFPEWTADQIVQLIRRFFPGMDMVTVVELMHRFFVDLDNLADVSVWLLGEGILAKLVKRHHCDMRKCKLIKITANSTFKDFIAAHAVDMGNDQMFFSSNKLSQWFCYELKCHLKIPPIGYGFENAARDYAKELVVEGSDEGKSWFELSHQQNALMGPAKVRVRIACSNHIQMVHVRLVGMNGSGNHRLEIRSFDIFGFLTCDMTARRKENSTMNQIARVFPDVYLGGSRPVMLWIQLKK